MMDSGRTGIKQAVECGQTYKEKVIWVSGKMIRLKVLEFLS